MKTAKKYYVYALATVGGTIFYVGKGTGGRISVHENEARRGCSCHKCKKIRKIWRDGGQVVRKVLLEVEDECEAYEYEIKLIRQIGLDNLTNTQPGGEGGVRPISLDKHLCDTSLEEFDLYLRRLRPSKRNRAVLVLRWRRDRIDLLTSERAIAKRRGDYELAEALDQEINQIYATFSKAWQQPLRF